MLATVSLIGSAAQATPITATLNGNDLVKVGDPGNAAQVSNGFGAVADDFWIGKYQVTIGQYTEFLNAVAKTNDRGLYDTRMVTDQRIRGIAQSGLSGSFEYTVVGPNGTNPAGATSPANRPITYLSWFDAARFANWMANGKPTGAAGSTTTGCLDEQLHDAGPVWNRHQQPVRVGVDRHQQPVYANECAGARLSPGGWAGRRGGRPDAPAAGARRV